jgi:hypothetical protein
LPGLTGGRFVAIALKNSKPPMRVGKLPTAHWKTGGIEMAMWKFILPFLLLSALGLPASAQELQPQMQNGVTYVSGGVGLDGVDAIKSVQGEYNLRLLFASTGSGQYYAEVKVTLADQAGNVLVQATSDGPYFYARLKPGQYKVLAEADGMPKTFAVNVPASGAVSQSVYWPMQ